MTDISSQTIGIVGTLVLGLNRADGFRFRRLDARRHRFPTQHVGLTGSYAQRPRLVLVISRGVRSPSRDAVRIGALCTTSTRALD